MTDGQNDAKRAGRARVERDNVVRLPRAQERDLEEQASDSLEALRGALEDLRREIRARLPQTEVQASPGSPDWIVLFDELRAIASRLGMRDRAAQVDDFGLDAQALASSRPLLDLLLDRYWRVEVRGTENLPPEGPCLFVANRSGLLPYDGLVLSHVIERSGLYEERARFMVADWFITLPFAQPVLARLGGVRACRENADRLLRSGRSVIAFPEGEKGAAKAFRERYRLKRFGRGGSVRAALDNHVPLVPVGLVGPEEAHPILFKTRTAARPFGLPFLPVTPTFPLMGPLGMLPMPTKWIVCFGEPIRYEDGRSDDDEARDADPDAEALQVSRATETLRERIRELIEEGLAGRSSVWG